MAASIRELRRRINSVNSTKKITRAQELIATTRIAKAQAKAEAAKPYSKEMTNVMSALAGTGTLDHPLLVERPDAKRAAVLVITADRGLCGGYNSNAIKTAEELMALLREQGKEPVLFVTGRRGVGYYTFRGRDVADSWTGFSERPEYGDAKAIADTLIEGFMNGLDDGEGNDSNVVSFDEVHMVYTQFASMLSQVPTATRIAPLEVEYEEYDESAPAAKSGSDELSPAYEFEPGPSELMDAMLPKYITTRIFSALLESAASESAARRAAMKSATDNANELIRNLTREANQARQAQITQEISEIVGGADALASAGSDD
ncbi:F0F1 ATP synthase subunit gamma [Epidermidibacterium keratini]|uniref:ATP synthase gamma chain n=1 Tax=Epidermidibacterium keratini TaxID=1891644 RepID=A0A7L4YR31_9ACTN|nr:F0F1 ATP synthase subunit gamma [Epidermidibacterium keratini]QHC01705.1 F0F1 ATP synthase subunit gamma [Epidermidibacterium keratini]